jgi:DNA-binding response OmpR family regulator
VLILTARGFALEGGDLRSGNIRDVLSKPFSPRAILEQVAAILGPPDESRRRMAA